MTIQEHARRCADELFSHTFIVDDPPGWTAIIEKHMRAVAEPLEKERDDWVAMANLWKRRYNEIVVAVGRRLGMPVELKDGLAHITLTPEPPAESGIK